MRFRIFGDGDCPAWWLASLHALAAAPAPAVRALAQCVLAERDQHAELDEKQIIEILADTPLNSPEGRRRACACLSLCRSAARARACSARVLAQELQLAGLPRAHAHAVAEALDLQSTATDADHFLVNQVTAVDAVPADARLVDCVQICMRTSSRSPLEGERGGEHEVEHVLGVPLADLPELIRELKQARAAMEGL